MANFNVTFTETKKYNPATRTVMVTARDEEHAKLLVTSLFDSFTIEKDVFPPRTIPSGKHITITKIKEIKEKKIKEKK